MTEPTFVPFREPLRTTLTRTFLIALVAGAIVSLRNGGLRGWPIATILMLWPSFGGHWLEYWYLNWLRPRLSPMRAMQVIARLATWFVGGIVLAVGLAFTALALTGSRPIPWHLWWAAGLAMIAIELAVHAFVGRRGRPNFFDGRG
jgi:hypothetical protein